MPRVAIIDDYQSVALKHADWTEVHRTCDVTVFTSPFGSIGEAADLLSEFDIVCSMRERTAFPRSLIERLPKLKLITFTGGKHRTLDMEAATEAGIVCSGTAHRGTGHHATPELAWGLILALARHIPEEATAMRSGGWQRTVGTVLSGKTLGLAGLGRLGARMAKIGLGFEMEVIAWSQNLTAERARECGATLVAKDDLFARSDVLSLHLVLGERSRGVVGARELDLMKPTAMLVNTARGPLVDEAALLNALQNRRIAGAGLDVFHHEPLPDDHPLRALPNVVLTPHLGYTVKELFDVFYEDTVENILGFLAGTPVRVANPAVLERKSGG